jgi:hypothetical protein
VVEQPQPAAAQPAPPIQRPAAPAPPDRDRLRSSLHDKLSSAGGGDLGTQIWACAAALLLPAAPVPAVDVVDDIVALARLIVDTAAAPDQAGEAVDWFLLSVSLWLRDRLDPGGDRADRLGGAESLLTAARKIPLDHPAAITILAGLGAFLDEGEPFGGVLDVVGAGFSDRLDIAIAAGSVKEPADLAILHALRCLCRAAEAVADLRRAAGTVPLEFPWLAPLKAAAVRW